VTTTIGYRARISFANATAPLTQAVVNSQFAVIEAAERENFETCQLCGHTVAELFTRIDNRDYAEIAVCEHCADHGDVSHCAD